MASDYYTYGKETRRLKERQTGELINDSFSAKCFVGLAANKRAPDYSTLTVFKDRLIEKEGRKGGEGSGRQGW